LRSPFFLLITKHSTRGGETARGKSTGKPRAWPHAYFMMRNAPVVGAVR
jgi:hypothetical protein